ncbi:MAG TPA: peptidoglycan editing factor PgeF [Bacteroidales bacterium]|nr:MAG: hypothetical protein A2X01_12425 [Bacteroidetes bacterium GWF2_35_48]OFY99019.1 MAG: hypothetical protein A2491_15295 [Bacteroidetes bacterium RIFOXYC12_FULL_35_7]HBX53775.1 peptidoglycan editing factor PgeF [Bacteroidales bacterium]
MIECENKGLTYYKFSILESFDNITHFVSTRKNGYSKGYFESLNLGLKVGDDPEIVIKNRMKLADAVGLNALDFVVPSQSHTTNVQIVGCNHKGAGVLYKDTALSETDAMITDEPNICLLVFGADCVPVLFYDADKKVIGVAHAGWKGTVNKIVSKVLQRMQEKFGSCHENIFAAIGPAIGSCCYTIGEDVAIQFENTFTSCDSIICRDETKGTIKLNLWEANKILLMNEGIPEKNIEIAEICTSCRHDLFFSHRFDKGKTGRFGAGIMMKQ